MYPRPVLVSDNPILYSTQSLYALPDTRSANDKPHDLKNGGF
jgi:hypothetical protein